METRIRDLNNISKNLLPTPEEVEQEYPLTKEAAQTVVTAREEIKAILNGEDPRLLIIVGPCSIHDLTAAREYATKLQALSREVRKSLLIIMRVYFEKPRTSVGWKGFINDPDLNDSFQIEKGLRLARALLLEINALGLPVGTEALDPITPQYLDDLVSWTAIGARTVESQTHRELASGLSTPVGFKNGTDGSLEVAVNALQAASQNHRFLGINRQGQCCVFHSTGNKDAHIVLRGGLKPNYHPDEIAEVEARLEVNALPKNIMIDCSHGNSEKDPDRQPLVLEECLKQIQQGNKSIIGFMIESHLNSGSQKLGSDPGKLKYGISITDPCIDWKTTERMIRQAEKVSLERISVF